MFCCEALHLLFVSVKHCFVSVMVLVKHDSHMCW